MCHLHSAIPWISPGSSKISTLPSTSITCYTSPALNGPKTTIAPREQSLRPHNVSAFTRLCTFWACGGSVVPQGWWWNDEPCWCRLEWYIRIIWSRGLCCRRRCFGGNCICAKPICLGSMFGLSTGEVRENLWTRGEECGSWRPRRRSRS